MANAQEITKQDDESYRKHWPRAEKAYASALEVMPGGNTRTQVFSPPFPVYGARGNGATLELTDGAKVDDFLLNYTASATGHANPEILAAIEAGLAIGSPFGVPSESEAELGAAVNERFGLDLLRYTNSGSEATLHAIRAARAFTGRSAIAKAEGGYHGSHDQVDVSVTRFGAEVGEAIAESKGMSPETLGTVVVFPYNDLDRALACLEPHADRLAALIIEVVLNAGGAIPAEREYLEGLEAWCRAHDVLLIVDEVATWRLSYRGAAAAMGVKPDLICLGKALGGGLPVGAVGGRGDIMAAFDPRGSEVLRHAGTFNGHPAVMAAGRKVLEILTPAVVQEMSDQCDELIAGICRIGEEQGLPITATGFGGMGRIHLSAEPPQSARASRPLPSRLKLHRALLDRGTLVGADGRFATCSETSDSQVERFLTSLSEVAADSV